MARSLPILMLLVGLACSSGGGGGGGDGGDGSRITRGVVTRLIEAEPLAPGSATVAGTVYDTDLVEFEFDLRVGMKVTVTGFADGNEDTATTVVFDADLEGPITDIDSVDVDRAELTILDQTVELRRGSTVFELGPDPDLSGTEFGFDSIAEDQLVEVSGLRDGSGTISATLVVLLALDANPMPDVELKGLVSNLGVVVDDPIGRFEIGGIEIRYDPGPDGDTDLSGVPDMALTEGDFVEVEGRLVDPETVNAAVPGGGGRIELEDGVIGDDAEDVELEGIVSDFSSFPGLASFEVDGQQVNAVGFAFVGFNSAFEPSDAGFMQNGARVEVEGQLLEGVLFARIVKLRDGRSRVSAEIVDGDVDAAMGTIELLGAVQIEIDAATRFDGFEALDALGPEQFIEVRGFVLNDVLRATEIKLEDEIGDVELFGRVEGFDLAAGTFRLLGLEIPTDDPLTLFAGFPNDADLDTEEMDFYAFLASNPNAELRVKDFTDVDDPDATTLDLADQITRESSVRVAAELADDGDVDLAMQTIQLLDAVEIQVSDATAFVGFADLSELGMADFLEVHGVLVDGVLSAAEIRREDESDDVELRGRVEDFDESDSSFTILGLAIPTDEETEFDEMDVDGEEVDDENGFYDFLAENPTALLDVRDEDEDDSDATTLDFADRVKFRSDDN